MDKYIHKGDIIFALVLGYFLCAYRFVEIDIENFGWGDAVRLICWYGIIAVSLEVIFALVSCLRQKPLFGKRKMAFFAWKKVVPLAIIISAISVASCYFTHDNLGTPQYYILAGEFVAGIAAVMLYFYSLVDRK